MVPDACDRRLLVPRTIGQYANHPFGEASGPNSEGRVEPVEVDDREERRDLNKLLIAEVLLHAREQLVGDIHGRLHHANRVIERQPLALREQITLAISRERQQLLIGEARVAANLRAEVDAELATDHLRALQLDQVLDALFHCVTLSDRLLELAHAAHHLRSMRPDLDWLDPAAVGGLAPSQLLHASAHEPVDELDHRPGLALRYSLNPRHRVASCHIRWVVGVYST